MNSSSLPEHVLANRAFWTETSEQWVEPGRRSWVDPEVNWGIWSVPERELGALAPLEQWRGRDVIELGCGTAYFSAWMAKLGANPVGIDITPNQLATARAFQEEFGIEFPLIEGSAEEVPLPDGGFDLAISEYGASIWCDPYKWIPEAARLLKPRGSLVFLRNSTINTLCMPSDGPAAPALLRDYFGLHRVEWDNDASVEFHLPTGPMLRLCRQNGFELEDFIEIAPPADAVENRHEYVSLEWSKRWPSEEIWRLRKTG
jgi:SAM-dependent methyltransferase